MELKNILNKRIKRDKFFASMGAIAAGYVIMRSLPLRFLSKSFKKNNLRSKKAMVKLNSLAVSRSKAASRKLEAGADNV